VQSAAQAVPLWPGLRVRGVGSDLIDLTFGGDSGDGCSRFARQFAAFLWPSGEVGQELARFVLGEDHLRAEARLDPRSQHLRRQKTPSFLHLSDTQATSAAVPSAPTQAGGVWMLAEVEQANIALKTPKTKSARCPNRLCVLHRCRS